MKGEGSLTPFEHYLWNELESSQHIPLAELTSIDIGSIYWSKSGNLEEAVVYAGDGEFIGINFRSFYHFFFNDRRPRAELQESLSLGKENHKDAPDAGYVRPYVKIDAVNPNLDADNLKRYLVNLNFEIYEEKLEWLDMLDKRLQIVDQQEFIAMYEDAKNRLHRLRPYTN